MRNGGIRKETRSSALWGTGNRGGESRSSALWGKGGRGAVTALAAMLVLSVPFAASAPKHGRLAIKVTPKKTWISPGLVKSAKQHPNQYVRVIIQSTNGSITPALSAFTHVNQFADDNRSDLTRRLSLVDGVAASVRLRDVARLAKLPNLIVTPDVQVHVSSYSSNQLWPYETGVSKAWSGPDAPKSGSVPAIAIVDSGVEARGKDFGNRIVASVKFSTLPNDSAGDGRGHGTFVAGIAAGGADNYTGATPQAPIVSLDVMDDNGVARTSDVIAAAQWILANKAKYNIRVANFSLHSATKSHFFQDPLDQAVEKLWFSNVVVVAAAGNYGFPDKASGVLYAPGNDPFVITVGAIDIGGTKNIKDDVNAPWSAYGRTPDGFMKPELAAPGRYMVGPVPEGSTLAIQRADKVVDKNYIQLSGTSFAAPVIAGAAAQILAKHPEFTPDQVKGALMASTKDVDGAALGSVGVGELQMSRASTFLQPPNPNKALEQWVKKNTLTGDSSFDAVSWLDVAKANVSWDSVSWDSVSWADAAWNVVSWADVSWADVSWADVSWADVSWADVAWADSSYEDAAEGDTSGDPSGYELTPEQAAEIMADPETAPDPSALPAEIAAAVADPSEAAGATGATGPTGATGATG
ncbi:MAG TPA: S8 family serine peptidase [Gaiellaceae bacterium]|nr:S8 family serine peptidase [Gaiellaceae bacterium]